MPISNLNEEKLDFVLDLHRMGAKGSMVVNRIDIFKEICVASINESSAIIKLSDDFGERDIEVIPQVYTYDLKPDADSDDLCVGCATAYIISDDLNSEHEKRNVNVIDFCLMPDFYENDIINRFIRSLCEYIYEDFFRPSTISFHVLEGSFHLNALEQSLRSNSFARSQEPREQLVWHDPPLTYNLLPGSERQTRIIHRHVLDVQKSIDPFDGFREYPLRSR